MDRPCALGPRADGTTSTAAWRRPRARRCKVATGRAFCARPQGVRRADPPENPGSSVAARSMLGAALEEAHMESVKKTILVPVDFQEASAEALAMARDLAGRLGMELVLLHVY